MPRCLLVFEPPDGGVAEHVAQLAEQLPAQGWSVEVAGPARSSIDDRLEAVVEATTFLAFGRSVRPLPYVRSFWALRRMIRGGTYDLVHVHSSKAGVVARLAAWRSGTPVVYTPHCFAFMGPQSRPRRTAVILIERVLARLTAAIVCVAEDERAEALTAGVGSSGQLVTIVNGVGAPPDPPPQADGDLERWRGSGPLVACMTVLRAQKGLDVFLDAAVRVCGEDQDVRLAIVGDGPEAGALHRRRAELGLEERVGFFAFRAPAFRQLESIDVFVLPSRWEAMPISILEALAAGVPQVATAVGGTPEAVTDGQTGLLCPPEDVSALAAAILRLTRDENLRMQMSAGSRLRFEEHFRVERMASATAALYDRLTSR